MATAKNAVLIAALGLGPLCILWVFWQRRLPGWGRKARHNLIALVGPTRRAAPVNRPIEDIAVNVRRLGLRFHNLHPHASYAKVLAVRSAYDNALGECCSALGLPHLLGVLEPGPDQDKERERVEVRLAASGFVFPDAA